MDKALWRKQIQKYLNELTDFQYKSKSIAIMQKLIQEPSIIEGETIAVTMSVKPEVDTKGLIETFWAQSKTVVIPKCNKQTREMTFYEIENFSQMENVYMELLEPIPSLCKKVDKKDIDVCIVPGIVFDKNGYRIGYGGGYYDRFLEDYAGHKIALAFQQQVVNEVPHDSYDIPISILITEMNRYIF